MPVRQVFAFSPIRTWVLRTDGQLRAVFAAETGGAHALKIIPGHPASAAVLTGRVFTGVVALTSVDQDAVVRRHREGGDRVVRDTEWLKLERVVVVFHVPQTSLEVSIGCDGRRRGHTSKVLHSTNAEDCVVWLRDATRQLCRV